MGEKLAYTRFMTRYDSRKTHVINETCIGKFFFSKLVREAGLLCFFGDKEAGLLVSTAFVFWA